MKRTAIRRKPRTDGVPPETVIAVLERDKGCLAPLLGGSALDCAGRNRLEHVKLEPRAAKRAEPLMDRLGTLCEGHCEPGMRAGYQWNTTRENRTAMRIYLRNVGTFGRETAAAIACGEDPHVEPVHGCPLCMARAS